MALIDRWFIRCTLCLAVAAVGEKPQQPHDWQGRVNPNAIRCTICNVPMEVMGRVSKPPLGTGWLVTGQSIESPCDARCTNAKGPNCDCSCKCANHGSQLVVIVDRTDGIPKITPKDDAGARKRRDEFLALVERANALCPSGLGLAQRKRAGEYLTPAEFATLQRYTAIACQVSAAKKLRTHAGRVKSLTAYIERHSPAAAAVRA